MGMCLFLPRYRLADTCLLKSRYILYSYMVYGYHYLTLPCLLKSCVCVHQCYWILFDLLKIFYFYFYYCYWCYFYFCYYYSNSMNHGGKNVYFLSIVPRADIKKNIYFCESKFLYKWKLHSFQTVPCILFVISCFLTVVNFIGAYL